MSARITVLGPPLVAVEGRPAELLPAKAAALLAYLALAEAPVPRERLIGLLWAESFAGAARKNLRNLLWSIRRSLGEAALRAEGDRLALGEQVWVDARVFERLARELPAASAPDRAARHQAVIAAYGGALLDGLVLQDAPEFEIWLTGARERLHQIYLRCLHEWAGLARAAGEWEAVADAARRALADDPLQEPVQQLLIEALARRGERAEALRQYESLRALLERELGVEPLPETEALRLAILDGSLRAEGVRRTGGPPARPPVMGTRTPTPFIGRAAELAALDAALARSLAGRPQVALLSGEVGIGKTRLWREWSARLASEILTLETRGLRATRHLPLAPLIDLFASPACAGQLFRPGSPVAPIWLAEVARLLPELRTAVPGLPQPLALPPDEERRHLFEAFVQCLRALEARGLVLFVDDLHWADQATLDWLAYLLARLRDRPLLLVASFRAEDADPAHGLQLALWRREGLLDQVDLARLSVAEIEALLAALPPGAGDPARARERSGGNPYFAIELYQAGSDELPLALADLVRARLERLPGPARQVLQAAAVLEPDIDFPALRRTSGRSEEEAIDALDALLQAGLLVEQAGVYRFAHPLIGAVVMGGLSSVRRAFLHRRAAEGLAALAGARLAPAAGRIAEHYAQAGERPSAARFAELAAVQALALAAPVEAVAWARRALELEPSAARWLGLAHALQRQGDVPAAREATRQARDAFRAAGDESAARKAQLEIAYTFLSSGQGEQTVRWAEEVLAAPGAAADPYLAAFGHFLVGAGLQQQGHDPDTAEQHQRRAAALAQAHRLPLLTARVQFQLGNLLAERGELTEAIRAFRAAAELAGAADDVSQQVLAYNNAAYHSLLAGERAAAHALIGDALRLAERHALLVPLQWLFSTQGELALAEGHLAEAEGWFRRALAEAEQQHNQALVAGSHAALGRVALARGERAAALALLRQAQTLVAALPARHLQRLIAGWIAQADQ